MAVLTQKWKPTLSISSKSMDFRSIHEAGLHFAQDGICSAVLARKSRRRTYARHEKSGNFQTRFIEFHGTPVTILGVANGTEEANILYYLFVYFRGVLQ